MFKLQLTIEKFFLSAIVIVVAIVVSYFLYKSFYSVVSHTSIKSYLTQASLDNIYGNKTAIFILLKNETNIGSNVIISEMITFNNGTSKTYSIPFALQMASTSEGGFLYDFETTDFPAISNNSQPIKISNVFIISGNYTIESENSSITYSSYYYTKSSLENIPLYYLNMSVTPLGAGDLVPGNGYYYAGSKVAISEKPNIGYAFSGWSGFGNGNYTGPNQTAIIEMNSNITEYAKYVKLVKMYVNATYNGIPVYVNGVLNTTTNGTIYLIPGVKYTLSVPMYVSISSGGRYLFTNLQDDCGISISPNSNSTTFVPSYANYNCKFTANYAEQYYLIMSSNNTSIGTVSPSSGWYNKGSNVEIIATTNLVCYNFSNWEGSGTGSYSGTLNKTNIIINSPINEKAYFKRSLSCIVLTNNQTVPTPSPFQQMIQINESKFSGKIIYNNNFANFEFTYQNGTVIPAWIESNQSGILTIWIKLANGIPANSKTAIYLRFAGSNNLLSSSGTSGIGEAPQLSCPNPANTIGCSTYAEYDDGASVFNNYWNFAGTSLPNSLADQFCGGIISVNNGITFSVGGVTGYDALVISNAISYPQITDALIQTSVSSTYPTAIIGEATSSVFASQCGWIPNGYAWDYYQNHWRLEYITTSTKAIIASVSSNITAGDIYSIVWVAVGNEKTYINYINQVSSANTAINSIGNYHVWLGIDGNAGNSYSVQWLRTRAYPPNGVMPSVSFG